MSSYYKCKTCNLKFGEDKAKFYQHRLDAHGVALPTPRLKKAKPDDSPTGRIRAAEQSILDSLKELDAQRNQLQNQIKNIDNTAARYTRFLEEGRV